MEETKPTILFNKKRAHEYFNEGVITAMGAGVLIAVALLIIRPFFVKTLHVSPEIITCFNQYYRIIVFYLMLEPLSCLLDHIVVSDGGEYLSAVLNVLQITGNVILSFILAGRYGVVGIADYKRYVTRIHIYAFELSREKVVALSETVMKLLLPKAFLKSSRQCWAFARKIC